MKHPIPIHDATAPIACTAGAAELPARKEQIARLRSFGPAVERTEHGMLLHFVDGGEVAAELADFVVAEQGCCAFWGFEIATAEGSRTLRWDGPPAVGGILDQLTAFFEGDAELDLLEGLL